MIRRLGERQERAFFAALFRAAPAYAVAWWVLLVARGALPALLAVTTGVLIGAIQHHDSLAGPLTMVGIVFVAYQVLTPIHQVVSANLGSRTAAWLNDRLMVACNGPDGLAHLERADLLDDLTMARDFDLGISGPPLSISMGFIASGLVDLVAGLTTALVLVPVQLVVADRAAGGMELDTLAAARERRVEGPQHRRGAGGPAPR